MNLLQRLQTKAFKIDLSHLPPEELAEIRQAFEQAKKQQPGQLSPEAQAEIETAINEYVENSR